MTYSDELIAVAEDLVSQWEGIQPFSFPKTKPGVRLLAETMLDLTGCNIERATEFSKLVGRVSPRCPTPLEMRKIYCSKWKPADGIEDSALDYERFFIGGARRKPEGEN